MAHVLALSDVGELYGWGANSYGQIGVGSTLNTSIPTLIHTVEERCVWFIFNFAPHLRTYFFVKHALYAHTYRFCVVQENIKPEVLEVQTELAMSVP